MKDSYCLRYASIEDLDLVYEWANDELVRAQSFSSAKISHSEHQAWFSSVLADSNTQLWIYCVNGVPAGQIRCKVTDSQEAIISYSIAAAFRGQGHGSRMIKMLPDVVRKRFPDAVRLLAMVKPQNTASNRIFLSNGYLEEYTCYALPLQESE